MGFIDTQIIMVQGRVWLSKNVLGVSRNDMSRLVAICRKKMLIVLPNTLSSECGMWTNWIRILWKPAQYSNSQTPRLTHWIKHSLRKYSLTISFNMLIFTHVATRRWPLQWLKNSRFLVWGEGVGNPFKYFT